MVWSPSTQTLVQRAKDENDPLAHSCHSTHGFPAHQLAGLNFEKIVRCLETNWNMDKLNWEWIFSQGLPPFKLGITCFLWCHLLASFNSFYHILIYFSRGIEVWMCIAIHARVRGQLSGVSWIRVFGFGSRWLYPACPLARLPSASYMKASQT